MIMISRSINISKSRSFFVFRARVSGKRFSLSTFLLTKDGAEIDLIVERARESTLCLEIKSGSSIR